MAQRPPRRLCRKAFYTRRILTLVRRTGTTSEGLAAHLYERRSVQ